jgi:hypothetical protein
VRSPAVIYGRSECEVGTGFITHTMKWRGKRRRKHLHCVEKYKYIVAKDFTLPRYIALLSSLVLLWIFATFEIFLNKNCRY